MFNNIRYTRKSERIWKPREKYFNEQLRHSWSFLLVRPVQLERKPPAAKSLRHADISLPDLLCSSSLLHAARASAME